MFSVLFLVAVLFTAHANGGIAQNTKTVEFEEDAQELIDELDGLIKNASSEALPQLEGSISQIRGFAGVVESNVQITIHMAAGYLRAQLDRLQEVAENAQAFQCTEGRTQDFESMILIVVSDTKRCTKDLVDQAVKAVDVTINEIKLIESEPTFLEQEIEACSHQSNPEECVQAVIEEIHTEILDVAVRIKEHTVTTLEIVKDYEDSLYPCGNDRAEVIISEGNKMIDEIEICIESTK